MDIQTLQQLKAEHAYTYEDIVERLAEHEIERTPHHIYKVMTGKAGMSFELRYGFKKIFPELLTDVD